MATTADIETIVMQLERNAAGHSHTAGKACTYLWMIADKPDAKFSNCTADEFIQAARGAAYQGKWSELRDLMSRWW